MTRASTLPPGSTSPFLVERTELGLRFPAVHADRPVQSRGGAPGQVRPQVFDFEAIADATFLGSFAADVRRPNLLLHCGVADIPRLVPRLARICAGPVRSCMIAGQLALPKDVPGTLILHDVSRLTVLQQIEVSDWIAARAGRTQIVSISALPLRELVEEGLFLQGLFHRLCVVEAAVGRRAWRADLRPPRRHQAV